MPSNPHNRSPRAASARRPQAGTPRQPVALSEREIDELQSLLDNVPAPLDPLDVVALDGYLCGVLVQPRPVPEASWLRHVTDVDGAALPASFDAARLHALVRRRHGQLEQAIAARQWFDPWVFELDDEGSDGADDPAEEDGMEPQGETAAVYPWVAGFATAMELFPALMRASPARLTEPLALLYRHLAPDDLEDADELLAEIESLEPPADLAESVEGLVRATLLLADVSRPR